MGLKPYSDGHEHEHGSFAEYGGVEPERLMLLQRALKLAGVYATLSPPGTWEQVQAACAERLQKIRDLRPEVAALSADPVDELGPVLASFDITWTEAEPYLRRPSRVRDRHLGDLHHDLMRLVQDVMVVVLRLVRNGASCVTPVQRWIGNPTAFNIWQGEHTQVPNLFYGALAAGRSLGCAAMGVTLMSRELMEQAMRIDWGRCSLSAGDMRAATRRYNAVQAANGGFEVWLGDSQDAGDEERQAKAEAHFRTLAAAIASDLRELLSEQRVYFGWSRHYDYD